jgi:hypothetical protein
MGLFNFIKKETYINRLVYNYKDVFQCGDMPAIKNLRYNYSVDELKKIFNTLKENPIHFRVAIKSLFKPHNSLL